MHSLTHTYFKSKQTCIECPTSYHLLCIPPKAKFHELALLCHKHCHLKLPDLDISTSLQGEVEVNSTRKELKAPPNKHDKKRKLVSSSESKFFTCDPVDWEQKVFELPVNFAQEVHSKSKLCQILLS